MFKFLALLIFIWIFFKAIGQIFRLFIGGPDANRRSRYDSNSRKQYKGGINVDHKPGKSKKDYEGGEYVDFEEVD